MVTMELILIYCQIGLKYFLRLYFIAVNLFSIKLSCEKTKQNLIGIFQCEIFYYGKFSPSKIITLFM